MVSQQDLMTSKGRSRDSEGRFGHGRAELEIIGRWVLIGQYWSTHRPLHMPGLLGLPQIEVCISHALINPQSPLVSQRNLPDRLSMVCLIDWSGHQTNVSEQDVWTTSVSETLWRPLFQKEKVSAKGGCHTVSQKCLLVRITESRPTSRIRSAAAQNKCCVPRSKDPR